METIKHLFVLFLKIAFAIFFIVFVVRLTLSISRSSNLTKTVSISASSTPLADLLPSPRKYSGFFTTTTASSGQQIQATTLVTPNAFVYNGSIASLGNTNASNITSVIKSPNGYTYTTYDYSAYPTTLDASGKYVIGSNKTITQSQLPVDTLSDSATDRRLTIRNLSIYQGGHVYTGLAFVGEARSTMFRDGKFPIIVVDATGKLVGISTAVAKTQWAVPGWVRFETRVMYPLPNNVPCTMIFEEALTDQERSSMKPTRVPFWVRCN